MSSCSLQQRETRCIRSRGRSYFHLARSPRSDGAVIVRAAPPQLPPVTGNGYVAVLRESSALEIKELETVKPRGIETQQ
jgi:hypothetical protein